jgi:ketosteroid isomerase-like protein
MNQTEPGVVESYLHAVEARDWSRVGDLLHKDVSYELPQTRERIVGRESYVQFNREYPGDWHLEPRMVLENVTQGAAWFGWRVGDERGDGIAFFELDRGSITKVTDFWPEPYEAPPGREHLTELMES